MPNNSKDSIEFILYGGPALQALLMFPEKFTSVLLWTLYVPESFCQKAHSHTFFGFDTRTQKGKEVMKERKSLKREIKIFTMRQQRVIKTEVCLLEKSGTRNPTICGQINSTLSLGVFVCTRSDRNLKGYRNLSCVSLLGTCHKMARVSMPQ